MSHNASKPKILNAVRESIMVILEMAVPRKITLLNEEDARREA